MWCRNIPRCWSKRLSSEDVMTCTITVLTVINKLVVMKLNMLAFIFTYCNTRFSQASENRSKKRELNNFVILLYFIGIIVPFWALLAYLETCSCLGSNITAKLTLFQVAKQLVVKTNAVACISSPTMSFQTRVGCWGPSRKFSKSKFLLAFERPM